MDYKYSVRHEDEELDKWLRQRAQDSNRSINGYILNILKMQFTLSKLTDESLNTPEMLAWQESQGKSKWTQKLEELQKAQEDKMKKK